MPRKIKPCYTLSNSTVMLLSSAVYERISSMWRYRIYLTGEIRATHHAAIRKLIHSYRQIEGYGDAKAIQAAHRSVMRRYSKKDRKRITAALRRARKASRSTPVNQGNLVP